MIILRLRTSLIHVILNDYMCLYILGQFCPISNSQLSVKEDFPSGFFELGKQVHGEYKHYYCKRNPTPVRKRHITNNKVKHIFN